MKDIDPTEEAREDVIDTTNDFILENPVLDLEAIVDWEKRIATYTDK